MLPTLICSEIGNIERCKLGYQKLKNGEEWNITGELF
jgi:hypothetical protein